MILKANSWTIKSQKEATKELDRSALIHNGTGIPKKIRFFFEIEEMAPGENKKITLVYNGNKYMAKFNMESSELARTRMFWHTDFEEILNDEFRDEYEEIISSEESDQSDKSSIVFHKNLKDVYIVTLIHGTEANQVKEQGNSVLYDFSGIDTLSMIYREFQEKIYQAFKGSRQLRMDRLKKAPKTPKTQNITTKIYVRNPDLVAEVLYRANGVCERCGSLAPFKRATDGTAYLEVHHKRQLAAGGEDTVENAIATCPNCHRELHYGQLVLYGH